jgi:hypothetical protein
MDPPKYFFAAPKVMNSKPKPKHTMEHNHFVIFADSGRVFAPKLFVSRLQPPASQAVFVLFSDRNRSCAADFELDRLSQRLN